jgi:hypothetical protein
MQQFNTNVMYDQRLLINVNRSSPLSPSAVDTNSVCLFSNSHIQFLPIKKSVEPKTTNQND